MPVGGKTVVVLGVVVVRDVDPFSYVLLGCDLALRRGLDALERHLDELRRFCSSWTIG